MTVLQYFIQNQYALATYGLIIVLLVAMFARRLPTVNSIQALATMLNTRGGNILLLGGFSFFFFVQAMKLFYNLIDLIRGNQLTPDNAFALMALQFVTSTAFGGAFGAMLKTMTGDAVIPPAGDQPPAEPTPAPVPPPPPQPTPLHVAASPVNDIQI